MFGRGTFVKDFGATDPMEIYRNKAYAAFEAMEKLLVDFFCFHDRGIVLEADTLGETNAPAGRIFRWLSQPVSTVRLSSVFDRTSADWLPGARPPKMGSWVLSMMISAPSRP